MRELNDEIFRIAVLSVVYRAIYTVRLIVVSLHERDRKLHRHHVTDTPIPMRIETNRIEIAVGWRLIQCYVSGASYFFSFSFCIKILRIACCAGANIQLNYFSKFSGLIISANLIKTNTISFCYISFEKLN